MRIILVSQEAEIRRIRVQLRVKFARPYLVKAHHKKGLVEAQSIDPEFKPQY
jgi:hypothetical protein